MSLLLALVLLLGGLSGCAKEAAGSDSGNSEAKESLQTETGTEKAAEAEGGGAEGAAEASVDNKTAENSGDSTPEESVTGGAMGGMIGGVMIPNPWTDGADKAEAEKLAGFRINTALELVEGAKSVVYRVMNASAESIEDRLIEVIYYDDAENEILRIRKARTYSKDISGDYNSYTVATIADYSWGSIEASGTAQDSYKKATWQTIEEGAWNSYSLTIEGDGWALSKIEKLVLDIINDVISKDLSPVPKEYARDPSKATVQPFPVGAKVPGVEGEAASGSAIGSLPEAGAEAPWAICDGVPKTGQEYSPRTLLISVTEKFSEAELKEFCEKYGLSVTYDYNSFNMYAMSLAEDHSVEELRELAARIEAENEKVTGCELDAITRLTDPVKPETSAF